VRDEMSYTDFVSARWSALFRLAYLLAGTATCERAMEVPASVRDLSFPTR
jgi:hypothetical protein